jgi:hypothetical protein
MEQGDQAIQAPHVSELQEGKIVFATGQAVGRVVKMSNNGTLSLVVALSATSDINEVININISDSGVLIPGPHPRFMDLNVEIPQNCATPKQGV